MSLFKEMLSEIPYSLASELGLLEHLQDSQSGKKHRLDIYIPELTGKLDTVVPKTFVAHDFHKQGLDEYITQCKQGDDTYKLPIALFEPERGKSDKLDTTDKVEYKCIPKGKVFSKSETLAVCLDYRDHFVLDKGASVKTTQKVEVGLTKSTTVSIGAAVTFSAGMGEVNGKVGLHAGVAWDTAWNHTTTHSEELHLRAENKKLHFETFQPIAIFAHYITSHHWMVTGKPITTVNMDKYHIHAKCMVLNFEVRDGIWTPFIVYLTQNQLEKGVQALLKEHAPKIPSSQNLSIWLLHHILDRIQKTEGHYYRINVHEV